MELEKADKKSKVFKKVRRSIAIHDVLTRLRIKRWDLLMCAIFKQGISEHIIEKFHQGGWKIQKLPTNPFIGHLQAT